MRSGCLLGRRNCAVAKSCQRVAQTIGFGGELVESLLDLVT